MTIKEVEKLTGLTAKSILNMDTKEAQEVLEKLVELGVPKESDSKGYENEQRFIRNIRWKIIWK